MHERLIGEEVALDVPCSTESSGLVTSFAEELIGVGGGEPVDREGAETELFALVEAVCAEVAALGTSPNGQRLEVMLRVTETGVEISLRCPFQGVGDRHYTVEEA